MSAGRDAPRGRARKKYRDLPLGPGVEWEPEVRQVPLLLLRERRFRDALGEAVSGALRTQYRDMESLTRSIIQNDVYEPLVVYAEDMPPERLARGGQPRYYIVDGYRRWKAARDAGLTSLPCRVLKGPLDDLRLNQIALCLNLNRSRLPRRDVVRALKRQWNLHRAGQPARKDSLPQYVQAILGLSRVQTWRLLRAASLPQEVAERAEALGLSTSHFTALSGLRDPGLSPSVVEAIAAHRLGREEAAALVQGLNRREDVTAETVGELAAALAKQDARIDSEAIGKAPLGGASGLKPASVPEGPPDSTTQVDLSRISIPELAEGLRQQPSLEAKRAADFLSTWALANLQGTQNPRDGRASPATSEALKRCAERIAASLPEPEVRERALGLLPQMAATPGEARLFALLCHCDPQGDPERLAALLPQVKEALASSPWAAHLYTALAELLELMEDTTSFRDLPPAVGRALVKMVEAFIRESAAIDDHLSYVVEMHWPQRAGKGLAGGKGSDSDKTLRHKQAG